MKPFPRSCHQMALTGILLAWAGAAWARELPLRHWTHGMWDDPAFDLSAAAGGTLAHAPDCGVTPSNPPPNHNPPEAAAGDGRFVYPGDERRIPYLFHPSTGTQHGPLETTAGRSHLILNSDILPPCVLDPVRRVVSNPARPAPGSYGGREADAPWRKPAAERIEKHRKADLIVRVMDARGAPVRDAAIQVRMTRQAFPFASCVSADLLVRGNGPDAERYRRMVDEGFSHVTVEYESCQIPWESDKTVAMDALKWLRDHGKTVHGCHIIWPHPEDGLPKDIVAMKHDPAAMRQRILGHIDEKVSACKGMVSEWNAINELFTNRLLEETLGKPFILDIFKRAKRIDPTLRLDMNDYGDMANPSAEHIEGHLAWVRYAKEQGAMMDVVGLQCHFNTFLRPMDESFAILDRFAAAGYPIHITELDVNLRDEWLQADFMRDIMTLLYSHPALEKITLWGFWEGRQWMPQAALWRKDWSIKPVGKVWMDLVKTQWRTNVDLQSDGEGLARVRAFHGEYVMTATAGDKTASANASVGRDGATVTLRFQ